MSVLISEGKNLFVPLVALISPFIIWPIELLLPFPYIVEEIVKAAFVVSIVDLPEKATQVKIVLAAALAFTLSETILYFLNITLNGGLSALVTRLILTGSLHSLTMIIMLTFTFRSKRWILIGLIVAMLIHYSYNLSVRII